MAQPSPSSLSSCWPPIFALFLISLLAYFCFFAISAASKASCSFFTFAAPPLRTTFSRACIMAQPWAPSVMTQVTLSFFSGSCHTNLCSSTMTSRLSGRLPTGSAIGSPRLYCILRTLKVVATGRPWRSSYEPQPNSISSLFHSGRLSRLVQSMPFTDLSTRRRQQSARSQKASLRLPLYLRQVVGAAVDPRST